MALAALGLSGAPVHEPVRGESAHPSSRPATVRNIARSARPARLLALDAALPAG